MSNLAQSKMDDAIAYMHKTEILCEVLKCLELTFSIECKSANYRGDMPYVYVGGDADYVFGVLCPEGPVEICDLRNVNHFDAYWETKVKGVQVKIGACFHAEDLVRVPSVL